MSALADILWLTVKLAAVTTLVLLVVGTPLAWWLARSKRWWAELIGAATALPVVLPPTVLGFYLLLALGANSPLMAPFQAMGIRTLAFTFTGLVIGSVVYSLPFAVQPLRNAFRAIGQENFDAAETLGASGWATFFRVAAPLAAPGYLVAAVLAFAHTVGEFGVVLMIGGGIPGKTEVVSIEMYRLVESLDWQGAHVLAAILASFGFAVTLSLLLLGRRLDRIPNEA